ncbi:MULTISPECIES: cysteine--tRNA ligase [unclassified Lebetimonas]|uniref:cysteine--tRNA ligase n=1 Tax=unclassified Lebetimonas TaxID=2648158 RepID=UPI0004667B1C|nr:MULTISPECIES: cysteine--tRNA ligase [unclassified Lebetimonas]
MKIYDSHLKEKVEFKPIKNNEVRIYVCGPTVYDDAHLGHARSSISFDLLRRTLLTLGYKVTFVKNFTDIDDKIINKMKATSKSLKELTEYYINSYLRDMDELNILRADIEPKATETLEEMFDLIEKLVKNGCTYTLPNGDIYFDTSKDPQYCSLSNKCQDSEENIQRIKTEGKKNPRDFALWKACKGEDDVCFDSPFGKGRPGWHLECSAMIKKHIAYPEGEYQIDLHGGGADLFFPHHENEEAQSWCAYNQHLAKYWMHNGFVTINGEKMSKSLGNSFFVKDALKHYPGEVLRFYLMSTHYRAPLNFSEEDLIASKKRLDKLYRLKKRVYAIVKKQKDEEFEKNLLLAMEDDLNISKALAAIDEFVKLSNEKLDKNPKDKTLKQKIISNIDCIDKLLGVGGSDAYKYFQSGIDENLKTKIEELIQKREYARKNRDFTLADKIRDQLNKLDIQIQDTPNGTVWEKN